MKMPFEDVSDLRPKKIMTQIVGGVGKFHAALRRTCVIMHLRVRTIRSSLLAYSTHFLRIP